MAHLQMSSITRSCLFLCTLLSGVHVHADELSLSGLIGGKYHIHMRLTTDQDQVRGSYAYKSKLDSLQVSGAITADGKITLQEVDGSGTRTGSFDGQRRDDGVFTGVWRSNDGKRELPFELTQAKSDGDLESTGPPQQPASVSDKMTEAEQTVDVEATGTGLDAETALRNAFQRAVELAVGMVVDATTKINGDDLHEKIILHSDAYIDDYHVTGETKNAAGLPKITIQARVKRSKLVNSVAALGTSMQKVDATSVYAQEISKAEAIKSGTELLQATMQRLKFPEAYLKATLVQDTENSAPERVNVDVGQDEFTLAWPIRIEFDTQAYYDAFAPEICKTLKQIATDAKGDEITIDAENDLTAGLFKISDMHANVALFTRQNDHRTNVGVNIFILDESSYTMLARELGAGEGRQFGETPDAPHGRGPARLRVTLQDDKKQAIVSDTLTLPVQTGWRMFPASNGMLICPLISVLGHMRPNGEMRFQATLSGKELQRLDEIKIEILEPEL